MPTIMVIDGPVLQRVGAPEMFQRVPHSALRNGNWSRPVGRAVKPGLDLEPDDMVSEHHAEFRVSEGKVALVDLKSTNGTRVERRGDVWWLQPGAPEVLVDGDKVGIGRTLIVYFDDDYKDDNEAMAAIRRNGGPRDFNSVFNPPRNGPVDTTT